jgi:hypothetical protein
MNIDIVITGLVSLLIGLTAHIYDKPRTAREKKEVPLGLTEAHFKTSKWALIIGGLLIVIFGLFNEQ